MARHSQRPRVERLIVGIAGRIGSGKTTVGKHLESAHGFQYLRYSAVLADWLATDPDRRAHLQNIGWEVMAGGMQAELNRRLISQIKSDSDAVVDGLRHPIDYKTLNGKFSLSFRLIYTESLSQLRFERLRAKGKYLDFASFEAADSHPVEGLIDMLRAKAALVISNEASLSSLYARADEAISLFRKEGQL
jgi:dephospho-CoA kinase